MGRSLLELLRKELHSIDLQDRVDQVVSMIFRTNYQSEIELLLLQRNYSVTDLYSGDICLPGGYRQIGQTCLTAAMRQVAQETSLPLKTQNYLGALNYTLFTRKGKSKIREPNKIIDLNLGVFLFQIQYSMGNQIKLQEKQIRAYKWIKLSTFFQGSSTLFRTWDIMYDVLPNLTRTLKFPAYEIGMERILYGITMYTLTLFLMTVFQMNQKYEDLRIPFNVDFYNKMLVHVTNLQIDGSEEELSIAKRQYVDNRVGFLKAKL